jgi:hypothetical protein
MSPSTLALQEILRRHRSWVISELRTQTTVTSYEALQQMIADLASLMYDAGRDDERAMEGGAQ